MKNFILLSIIAVLTITACVQTNPVKTIDSLKIAIMSETSSSIIYSEYSKKAQLNYPAIALFFEAVSKSDSIKAVNYNKLLEKLGGKMDEFTPEFDIKPTLVNLQESVKGVNNAIVVMYPGLITDATEAHSRKAVKFFSWAVENKKADLILFKKAITAVFERIENSDFSGGNLPKGYAICPVCGKIYDSSAIDKKCELCNTRKGKFLSIKEIRF